MHNDAHEVDHLVRELRRHSTVHGKNWLERSEPNTSSSDVGEIMPVVLVVVVVVLCEQHYKKQTQIEYVGILF